jgi:hypothetical protein
VSCNACFRPWSEGSFTALFLGNKLQMKALRLALGWEASMYVETGISAIGRVEWGSHFCHFYRTADDLTETLVPFFKVGLEQNEA